MDEQNLQILISELQNGNDQQRRAASYKLSKSKNPMVVPTLIHAYTDADGSVRQNAVDGLRNIGSKEAQNFLISQGQSVQVPQAPKSNLGFRSLPIIAGVLTVFLILGIAILSSPAGVIMSDSDTKRMGTIALVVSFVVFYLTKQWVDKKLK